jgi:dienelactone hydrolase
LKRTEDNAMQHTAQNETGPLDRSDAIVGFRTCQAMPDAQYFYARPSKPAQDAPVLVSVHGISRNAREHVQTFAQYCSSLGWVVVTPLFPADLFPKYQQLGFARRHARPRPDLALNAILDEITALTGANTEKVYMFGFSGGGQFVHRYAMVNPHRVIAAALGAPGWYTFPDTGAPFPRGLSINAKEVGFRLEGESMFGVPTAVFVGTQDLGRDETLNASPKIDDRQGRTRPERGRRWIAAMRAAARSRGLDTRYEFRELQGCGHSFTECMVTGRMDARALEFLIGAAAATTNSGTTRRFRNTPALSFLV